MTEKRLKTIKTWAEETLKIDSNANAYILLGVAIAHIKELIDGVEASDADAKSKEFLADHSKKVKDILDLVDLPKINPSPLTQPLPFNPYTPPMYGAGFTTSTHTDLPRVTINGVEPILFTNRDTTNLPAEAISDELVEKVANDTNAVDAVLDSLNGTMGLSDAELEKVEKVDAQEFSKPTKVEELLAQHFEVERKVCRNVSR